MPCLAAEWDGFQGWGGGIWCEKYGRAAVLSPWPATCQSHTVPGGRRSFWYGLSCSQQKDCLAKMIYSEMKLVRGLVAFSSTRKYSVETLWQWLLDWPLFLLAWWLSGSWRWGTQRNLWGSSSSGWSGWRSRWPAGVCNREAYKDGDKLSEEVDQMASLGDKKEVEAVSVMVSRVKKFPTDQVS